MAKVQKVYTREFKEEAVRLAQTSGKPITQVARELGISDTSIHQWRKELVERGTARALPLTSTSSTPRSPRTLPRMGVGPSGFEPEICAV